ncbi:MAG: isopentenyl-diphosphate Delta-isomerase [Bacteroidetes bacterium]|nr:isopentenyl-diphosphate Delta-isomerase [Cryomorphaceae bacterium]MBL6677619.1 isopentenyl-diphosphate Delta-isomerase [Flavobacteriaceae bacterium]MDA0885351.1 isopentenyl-diphosphate Delta-isomerase [Bacteroidota bacterium]
MSKENVILVDEKDNQVGLMPKLDAHQKGLLHRAFSVFIFNSDYKLLLQKRASSKYHSGGLWTNTCCSHPRDGEDTIEAANRRLYEEMGIKTSLRKVFDFIYRAELDNNLIENEFDHVFYGVYNHDPILNTDEADDFKWIDMETLKNDIDNNPDQYTVWFKIAFDYFYNYLKK